MINTKARIGEILKNSGVITAEEHSFCVDLSRQIKNKRFGEIVSAQGFATERDIARELAQQVGFPFFTGEYIPDLAAVETAGLDFLKRKKIFPARHQGRTRFVLAFIDDVEATDVLKVKCRAADFCVGEGQKIIAALERLESPLTAPFTAPERDDGAELLRKLLNRAIQKKASDIHIEPTEEVIQFRFRLDGVLVFELSLDKAYGPRIANIIFSKAEIDTSAFNKFHDGRFSHAYLGRDIDVRVSHIPTIYGSSIVLRLLDKAKFDFTLADLGWHPEQLKKIQQSLRRPDGIILLTGPTGCGKTTTLYAILHDTKSLAKKIITVEDPVEYVMPLVTQVQINKKQGVDYHNAARSILRSNPEIILIGEIRDPETANQAMKAAITGHKVYSTLHTITPFDALIRLQDLGVATSYLANSLECVIAQRLVRTLCPRCAEDVRVSQLDCEDFARAYIPSDVERIRVSRGCGNCVSGYQGRRLIAEVLVLDERLKMLLNRGDIAAIFESLRGNSRYVTFKDDILRLIREGQTDYQEAVRVLG
ncbi:MAG: Flp pilus assembly complex ATPase component TadA [Candidatus Omnitrophica bacterium]|nr:Flp pilus assembly complex ATPase component TadA [Candidatus Omnitrophota bacterium]